MEAKQSRTAYVVHGAAATRQWLQQLLSSQWLNVTAYASAEEFLAVNPRPPACLILDLRLPGLSGLELQRQLIQTDRFLPAIFIAERADIASVVTAMKQGAIDFLKSPFSEELLVQQVHAALEYDHLRFQKRRTLETYKARLALLSEREYEVLEELVRGGTSRTIAENLNVSPKTVDMHRANLLRKTRVRSVAEIACLYCTVMAENTTPRDPFTGGAFMTWPMLWAP